MADPECSKNTQRRGVAFAVRISRYIAGVQTHDHLGIEQLRGRYREGSLTPAALIEPLLAALEAPDERNVWITRLARERIMEYVEALEPGAIDSLPLYGIPFAIKDNIDLAGVPTSAGCPEFAYTPHQSARVVRRLLDAGAIPLGKTNLDQFATGLVGVRSPYGACRNSFNRSYIAGGSSSGSAVAVATGLASFSLGTDTAGSGRVPAAFNNIVGLKPSLGRLSTLGVVPACRSIDCVSIFALTAADAARVLDVAEGFDAADCYSRRVGNRALSGQRVGVPRPEQLEFFGDREYSRLFAAALGRLESMGARVRQIDFAPFLEAARLLYEGPWIAERYAAVGEFIETHADACHPVTRQIIQAGRQISAHAAFQGQYKLMDLKRASEAAWSQVDFIATPTAGTIYPIAAVEADPIRLNGTLGYYTNFMNFFELAGVAAPAGFRADGLPFGVTLVGPAGSDRALLGWADRLQRASVSTLGALEAALPAAAAASGAQLPADHMAIAVCGAHMQGLPLNGELRERGGRLIEATRTSAHYRLFALPGGPPHRPGLIRVDGGGAAIELEVWALPGEQVGSFLSAIPAPLGIGKIELQSGAWVSGFLCEAYATAAAADITAYRGWRAYLQAKS